MARKPPRLDAAYSLKTPADSRRLYRDWASTYDDDFAARMDYQMPARIAAVWQQREDRYSELRGGRIGLPLPVKVQMYTVGG